MSSYVTIAKTVRGCRVATGTASAPHPALHPARHPDRGDVSLV